MKTLQIQYKARASMELYLIFIIDYMEFVA